MRAERIGALPEEDQSRRGSGRGGSRPIGAANTSRTYGALPLNDARKATPSDRRGTTKSATATPAATISIAMPGMKIMHMSTATSTASTIKRFRPRCVAQAVTTDRLAPKSSA